jgi:hypothetical protein
MEAMMIRLHCSSCDEQIEVRAEYVANWGFRLVIPAGWALAMWPAPRQTVGCPHCIETSTRQPEKIDAFDPPNSIIPAPSPEADDAVGARQAEEFRKRFVNKPYGSKKS